MRKVRIKPIEFLLEWVDFPDPATFTWEPVRNLPNNLDMLHQFKEQYIKDGERWNCAWMLPRLVQNCTNGDAGCDTEQEQDITQTA